MSCTNPEQPRCATVASSSGEAIKRLRDDVEAVRWGLTWMLDPVGQVIVAGLAVVTLARVDPTLTLAVLAPVVWSSSWSGSPTPVSSRFPDKPLSSRSAM